MEDIQGYVETMRRQDSYHPDGRLKTLDEFLEELKKWEACSSSQITHDTFNPL
jgi:uncharacterized short protein YbdD (DUF466 family)